MHLEHENTCLFFQQATLRMTVLDCLGYLLLSIVLVWFLCLRRFGHGFKNFVKRKSGQYDDATYKMKSVMVGCKLSMKPMIDELLQKS